MEENSTAVGRLRACPVTEAFGTEVEHFTPWLATAAGIRLLSEAVGLRLELVQTEAPVGDFRADVLCRGGEPVRNDVVENQFGLADSLHLGKLLTDAVGHDARVAIWLAEENWLDAGLDTEDIETRGMRGRRGKRVSGNPFSSRHLQGFRGSPETHSTVLKIRWGNSRVGSSPTSGTCDFADLADLGAAGPGCSQSRMSACMTKVRGRALAERAGVVLVRSRPWTAISWRGAELRLSGGCGGDPDIRTHRIFSGGAFGLITVGPPAPRPPWTAPAASRSVSVMSEAQRDPEVLGGTPVFRGTRVPLRTLIEYLEGGQTVDEFVDDFPSVRREQVVAVLDEMTEQLVAKAG